MDKAWVPGLPPISLRRLNLQSYDRGHSTLRLVAPASWYWGGVTAQEETTIEMQFKDVAALALPESFATLDVAIGELCDAEAMVNLLGSIKVGDEGDIPYS